MSAIFERAATLWVRYDTYEIRTADNGKQYLTPAAGAMPEIIDPLEDAKQMVLDAINIGLMIMGHRPKVLLEQALLRFAARYGLLGLMTALPTTARFMDYLYVYLPKNDYIREESMETQTYTDLFFPFEKPTYRKEGDSVEWDIEGDIPLQALLLTFTGVDAPIAMQMSFLRSYAEDVEWLKNAFRSFAFNFLSVHYFYSTPLSAEEKERARYAMDIFEGAAPTYHIALLESGSKIMWNFHSLLLGLQMMFSFTITDPNSPIKLCKQCEKAYYSSRSDTQFCSDLCRRHYRLRHKGEE